MLLVAGDPFVKYASKQEFVDRIEREHACFVELSKTLPRDLMTKPGAWGEDWNIKDLFAHLTEWEQMFLIWYRDGLAGIQPDMPATGYKWNETRRLNNDIWKKYKSKSWKRVSEDFDASYDEVHALALSLSEKELLSTGIFAWTTKYPLTTYFGANTCSHYSVATKILRRWLKKNE